MGTIWNLSKGRPFTEEEIASEYVQRLLREDTARIRSHRLVSYQEYKAASSKDRKHLSPVWEL